VTLIPRRLSGYLSLQTGWLQCLASLDLKQKKALDAFAARKGVAIATLPTGQGLLLKP
jgi:hypothetical protein